MSIGQSVARRVPSDGNLVGRYHDMGFDAAWSNSFNFGVLNDKRYSARRRAVQGHVILALHKNYP